MLGEGSQAIRSRSLSQYSTKTEWRIGAAHGVAACDTAAETVAGLLADAHHYVHSRGLGWVAIAHVCLYCPNHHLANALIKTSLILSQYFSQKFPLSSTSMTIARLPFTFVARYRCSFNISLLLHRHLSTCCLRFKQCLAPPEQVRGMKTLDRDLFRKEVTLPYVLTNEAHIQSVVRILKPFIFKMPRFEAIAKFPHQTDYTQIILNPDLFNDETIKTIEKLQLKSLIHHIPDSSDYIGYLIHQLTYENYNFHEIFRAILPNIFHRIDPETEPAPEYKLGIPSFNQMGHIIHLNLRSNLLPYKHLIGQIFLDKISNSRLVINKLKNIDNKFRNFDMEILAKDDKDPPVDTVVTANVWGIRYKFDFAKVYWNPRLVAERERIVNNLQSSDVVYDVFAGVGPLALSAAKHSQCRVLANDLNPDAYRWLCENVRINRLEDLVKCFNLDGREFILKEIKSDLIECIKSYDGFEHDRRYQVVMNLPEIAVEFLDAFDGLLAELKDSDYEYKISRLDIHCYCFVKTHVLLSDNDLVKQEYRDYVIQLASNKLGHHISSSDAEVFCVRRVAPRKYIMCISFRLSRDILYGVREKEIMDKSNDNWQSDGNERIDSMNKRLKAE